MTLLSAAALAAATCISLPPTADRITTADLAPAWPALAGTAPDTALGFAPAPGIQRVFSSGELQRIGARLRVEGDPPAPVCVQRAAAPVEDSRLLEAMRRAIPDGHIEIVQRSRAPVPDGEIRFPIELLQPSGLWKGYVVYAPSRRFSLWARVKIRTATTRVVAVERLLQGQPIEASQVKLETVEAAPGADLAAHTIESVIGRLPRRSVPAGAPVSRIGLVEAPDVARGQTVHVQVQQGGARLELDARAEGDGRRGDNVQVTNPVSGRRFTARVSGKATVIVGGIGKERL